MRVLKGECVPRRGSGSVGEEGRAGAGGLGAGEGAPRVPVGASVGRSTGLPPQGTSSLNPGAMWLWGAEH